MVSYMKELLGRHRVSFGNAISGCWWVLKHHPNFRVHLLLSGLALGAGFFFQISRAEFLTIVFMIILGLSTEMVNTAIEAMTDLITKERREEAKIAKDVSAGMMLITALGATFVAGIIFLPRLAAL